MACITVKNKAILEALPNHTNGEVAYCEDDKAYMVYQDGWQPINATMDTQGLTMNLYDLNKSLYSQFTPLDTYTLVEKSQELSLFRNGCCYLLYGKEISYFHFFEYNASSTQSFGNVVLSILINRFDKIYSIEQLDADNCEIWVQDGDNTTMLMLMNWEGGVDYYG